MVSFSSSLYNCATECALRRMNHRCKVRFGSCTCNYCKYNINKYVNADPRHIELFMVEAERSAGAIKATSGGHHIVFAFLIGLCLLFVGLVYKDEQRMDTALEQYTVKVENASPITQTAVNTASVPAARPAIQQSHSNAVQISHQTIQNTLQRVARDLNNHIDVNEDRLINCIDAAVLFYQYFPDKSRVTISINKNDTTKMHHLFNVVQIDGVWRAIEPQTVWANKTSFWMRDVWGQQYDSSLNRDVTRDYIRYVR